MIKTLFITLLFLKVGNSFSQTILTDWKELEKSQTLMYYVENNAYNFLEFDPIDIKSADSLKTNLNKSLEKKYIIRDVASIKANRPALVINHTPILYDSILTKITMSDIEKITLLKPNETTRAVFGEYGKIGVIFIEIKKKTWRKLEKIR